MAVKTPSGERTLGKAETNLYCAIVKAIMEEQENFEFEYDEEEDLDRIMNYGNRITKGPFEDMTDRQRYTVLEEVTKHLVNGKYYQNQVLNLDTLMTNAIWFTYAWLIKHFKNSADAIETFGSLVALAAIELKAYLHKLDVPNPKDAEELQEFEQTKWVALIEFIARQILGDVDLDFKTEEKVRPPKPVNGAKGRLLGIVREYVKVKRLK